MPKVDKAEADRLRQKWQGYASLAQMILALSGLGLVVAMIGWDHPDGTEQVLLDLIRALAVGYALSAAVEIFCAPAPWLFVRQHWVTVFIALCILVNAIEEVTLSTWLSERLGGLGIRSWLIVIVAVQQVVALVSRLGEGVPWIERHLFARVRPGLLLAATFALLSLGGSLLLMMPKSTYEGIGFLDALFTSTSAVCVTGLAVVDTATHFTPIGQAIILLLIQLGGIGIVTITFFVALISGQGVAISSGVFLRDLLATDTIGRLKSALLFVIGATFLLEVLGAVALYLAWQGAEISDLDLGWYAIFHSISALCNAGFSVLPDGLANSTISHNRWGQVAIMCLIILGGIGFPVLREFWLKFVGLIAFKNNSSRPKEKGLSTHAKTTLLATSIFLGGGAVLFLIANRVTHEGTFGEAVWLSVFRSVSSRTAGFNIGDIGGISHGAVAVMMVLMFVGGSPGGMAGGIKTTTMYIAILNLLRTLKGKREVNLFRRRIDDKVLQRTFSVILLSLCWILCASVTIMLIQPELLFEDTLFEVVSAFATVGLTRGITVDLEPASQIVIVLSMFVGRIGLLNFLLSIFPVAVEARVRLPAGSVYTE